MSTFKDELKKIKKVYDDNVTKKKREALIEEWGEKSIILYGAGTLSGFVKKHLNRHGVEINGFADTFRSGIEKMTGLPIISASQLKEDYSDAVVIITSELHGESIMKTLKEIDYSGFIYSFDELLSFYTIPYEEFEPHIDGYEWAYNYYIDDISKQIVIDAVKMRLLGTAMKPSPNPQYFEPDICPMTDNEVFLDGGCFIGDTSEEFIRQVNGKYNHIYGFEPDENNLKKAVANLSAFKKIDTIHGGLWHMTNVVSFVSGEFGNSRFSEEGAELVKVFGIDDFFADKTDIPTFIKMDIEGAEASALDGAAETIKKHHPKLAICVYHSLQDMYVLPKRILHYNPDYKLFLRHYSKWYAESVCYAV